MKKRDGKKLFSAGDIVSFLECEHATTLALVDLEDRLPRAQDDESLQLIQTKGFAHESGYLDVLKVKGLRIAEIPGDGAPEELAQKTERAMRGEGIPRQALERHAVDLDRSLAERAKKLEAEFATEARRRAEREAAQLVNALREAIASAQAEAEFHKVQTQKGRENAAAAAREQVELKLKASREAHAAKGSALAHFREKARLSSRCTPLKLGFGCHGYPGPHTTSHLHAAAAPSRSALPAPIRLERGTAMGASLERS